MSSEIESKTSQEGAKRHRLPGRQALKWLSESKHTLVFQPKVENMVLNRQDLAPDPKYT